MYRNVFKLHLRAHLCPYLAPGGDLCVCEIVSMKLMFWGVVIHLTIFLPTTYSLAAGIAGGWHLLPECGWCGRDLWTKKRPVGVRDRCLGLQCCALSQLCTEPNLLWYPVCVPPPSPGVSGKTMREVTHLPDGRCLSGTLCSALRRDPYERMVLVSYMMSCIGPLSAGFPTSFSTAEGIRGMWR